MSLTHRRPPLLNASIVTHTELISDLAFVGWSQGRKSLFQMAIISILFTSKKIWSKCRLLFLSEKKRPHHKKTDWLEQLIPKLEEGLGETFPRKVFLFSLTCCCVSCHFSHVWLLTTPWTVACRLLCPWDSPGKNTGVGYPPGDLLTQEPNPSLLCLLHWHVSSLPLAPPVTVHEQQMGSRAVN